MVPAAGKLDLNVDVQEGNDLASDSTQPDAGSWLESQYRNLLPTLIRGEIAHANEQMTAGAGERPLPQLFGLLQPQNVVLMNAKLSRTKKADLHDAEQVWCGVESKLILRGGMSRGT